MHAAWNRKKPMGPTIVPDQIVTLSSILRPRMWFFVASGCHGCIPAPTSDAKTLSNSVHPFSTAVPFTGQTAHNLTGLSLNRDCSPRGVNRFGIPRQRPKQAITLVLTVYAL